MYISFLLVLVFVACFAALMQNGLWGNAIALINTVTAALLASSLWEPLADKLDKWDASYTYLWDFLAIWGIFAVSLGVMRAVTDALSKVKVRFLKPIDQAGGYFFAAWVGCVMVCFTLMTMHTAPLARSFLFGSFAPTPEENMMFGLAPDHKWLGFVQKMSLTSLSRSQVVPFDPRAEFILKYGERRARYEKELDTRVNPANAAK